MNLTAKILILVGILLIAFSAFLIFQRYSSTKLEFSDAPQKTIHSTERFPKTIIIETVDIKLPIHPAQIKNNRWDATTKGVSYLTSSPIPGEAGNSVVYGHNWSNILGRLPKVKPGDTIEIVYDDNTNKKFIVVSTSLVEPTQIGILNNTNDTRLTLYTCAGFLDSKRFVATAIVKG